MGIGCFLFRRVPHELAMLKVQATVMQVVLEVQATVVPRMKIIEGEVI